MLFTEGKSLATYDACGCASFDGMDEAAAAAAAGDRTCVDDGDDDQ